MEELFKEYRYSAARLYEQIRRLKKLLKNMEGEGRLFALKRLEGLEEMYSDTMYVIRQMAKYHTKEEKDGK